MAKADLIRKGKSDIRFRGLTDGTLNLILRSRFEEEIESYQPDLKKNFHEDLENLRKDKKSLEGLVRHLTGKMAEYQLTTEFRSKKRFSPSRYFANVADDAKLNIIDTKMRPVFQRPDGKTMELDILAISDCGGILAVEVKKTKDPAGIAFVRDFKEKIGVLALLHPDNRIIPAYFSTGGFTGESLDADIVQLKVEPFTGANPLSLFCFCPQTGTILEQAAKSAGFDVSRKPDSQLQAYTTAATRLRARLREKGRLSFDEARAAALERLKDPLLAVRIAQALAGRFGEVIVDEAQDCNPDDLTVISWLRDSGLPARLFAVEGKIFEHTLDFAGP